MTSPPRMPVPPAAPEPCSLNATPDQRAAYQSARTSYEARRAVYTTALRKFERELAQWRAENPGAVYEPQPAEPAPTIVEVQAPVQAPSPDTDAKLARLEAENARLSRLVEQILDHATVTTVEQQT